MVGLLDKERILRTKKLIDEKIQLLDKCGFEWYENRFDSAWNQNFEKLQEYIKKHNMVPPYSKRLYKWYAQQLFDIKNGKLSKERMDKLGTILDFGVNESDKTNLEEKE